MEDFGHEYKESVIASSIERFQDESYQIEQIEVSDEPEHEQLYLLFNLFLNDDVSSINSIDEYVTQNCNSIPDEAMITDPEKKLFIFIDALIKYIENVAYNQENLSIITKSLHLFALLSHDKLRQLNDYINEIFIQKLILLAQEQELEIVINSLWCISNLIWVSKFAFDLFYNNKLFSIISNLLSCDNEKILTLYALIIQRSLILLEPISNRYVEQLNNVTNNLSALIRSPFENPKYFATLTIQQLINIQINSIDSETVSFYLEAAFNYKDSEDVDKFTLSLSIISDLLSTSDKIVFEVIKNEDRVIEILKKGINFENEPKIQGFSIQSCCIIIKYIPEIHEKLIQFGIMDDIINISIEGDFTSKKNAIEAFCRILYNDESPLRKYILEKNVLEFLCDSFYYADDCVIEVVDVFNRIIFLPEPQGSNLASILVDYGLIFIINQFLENAEDSFNGNQSFIDKTIYLRDSLLQTVTNE